MAWRAKLSSTLASGHTATYASASRNGGASHALIIECRASRDHSDGDAGALLRPWVSFLTEGTVRHRTSSSSESSSSPSARSKSGRSFAFFGTPSGCSDRHGVALILVSSTRTWSCRSAVSTVSGSTSARSCSERV